MKIMKKNIKLFVKNDTNVKWQKIEKYKREKKTQWL